MQESAENIEEQTNFEALMGGMKGMKIGEGSDKDVVVSTIKGNSKGKAKANTPFKTTRKGKKKSIVEDSDMAEAPAEDLKKPELPVEPETEPELAPEPKPSPSSGTIS